MLFGAEENSIHIIKFTLLKSVSKDSLRSQFGLEIKFLPNLPRVWWLLKNISLFIFCVSNHQADVVTV